MVSATDARRGDSAKTTLDKKPARGEWVAMGEVAVGAGTRTGSMAVRLVLSVEVLTPLLNAGLSCQPDM